MSQYRLDKYLAEAGLGTRTQVKACIRKGEVIVNGVPIRRPEQKVDSGTDEVVCRGEVVCLSDFEYYLLNKPAGCVSAVTDPVSPTVLSYIDSRRTGLFPVGRLDKDTEGLLLITNDGALAHHLLSPKHHVDKTYYAITEGIVTEADVAAFAEGLHIGAEDLMTAMPARLTILNTEGSRSYINVTIQEGKFHQVKRMFQAVGKEVIYLKRISFGPLRLPDSLKPGQYRVLTDEEITLLKTGRIDPDGPVPE